MNPVGNGALDEGEAAGQGVRNEVYVDRRREAAQREGGERQQKGPFPEQGFQAVEQGIAAGRRGGRRRVFRPRPEMTDDQQGERRGAQAGSPPRRPEATRPETAAAPETARPTASPRLRAK